MELKLLALDMDGTLMKSDHLTLSPRNRAAIEKAAAKGVVVAVATGRMRGRIPEPVEAIPSIRYAVTSNGAAVNDLRTGRILYEDPLPAQTVSAVLDVLEGLPIYIEAYSRGLDYFEQRLIPLFDAFPLSSGRRKMMSRGRIPIDDLRAFAQLPGVLIEKLNLPYMPPELAEEILSRLRGMGDAILLTSSIAHNAEINGPGVSKASGLAQLCRILSIPPEQVMAMGDGGNDLEMLQFAGFSVVPANAIDEAKALANDIVASNDDDGVALAIERFLL